MRDFMDNQKICWQHLCYMLSVTSFSVLMHCGDNLQSKVPLTNMVDFLKERSFAENSYPHVPHLAVPLAALLPTIVILRTGRQEVAPSPVA